MELGFDGVLCGFDFQCFDVILFIYSFLFLILLLYGCDM